MHQAVYDSHKKISAPSTPCWTDNHGGVHFGDTLKEAKAKAAAANRDN